MEFFGILIRSLLRKPILITDIEISSSLYIFKWGFYFIRSTESKKTMIVFTKSVPFNKGTNVEIFGIIKPIVFNEDVNLVYVKEEQVKTVKDKSTSSSKLSFLLDSSQNKMPNISSYPLILLKNSI